MEKMKTGIELISEERQRQITKEGWSIEHDDEHINGELAKAADCYYEYAEDNDYEDTKVHEYWPWEKQWWKPKDQLSDFIRAGALYKAELERLDRIGSGVGQKLTNIRIGIRQCEIRIDELLKNKSHWTREKEEAKTVEGKTVEAKTAEEIFNDWINIRTVGNEVAANIIEAMQAYSSQQNTALMEENERLKKAIESILYQCNLSKSDFGRSVPSLNIATIMDIARESLKLKQ